MFKIKLYGGSQTNHQCHHCSRFILL